MNATVHHDSVRVVCPRAGTVLEFKRSGDMDCSKQPSAAYPKGMEQCCDVCPYRGKAREAAIKELDVVFWGAK